MSTTKVKIGGKLRPIRFSYGAMRKTCVDLNCSFADLDDYPNRSAEEFNNYMIALYFRGLEDGAKANGATFEIKKDDLQDWFDNMTMEELSEIQSAQTAKKKK